AADAYLAGLGVPYVVLRPSFVYGPGDHSMAFFAQLARLPVRPVPADGRTSLQPVYIGDLVRAIVQAVERDELTAEAIDVGGGEVVTFDQLLRLLASADGRRSRPYVLRLPWGVMAAVAMVTELLGGHGPLTRDELGMLRRDLVADIGPFI